MPPTKYFIITLSDDHPDTAFSGALYWCGYVSVGRTHSWLPSPATAIRFLTEDDALRAGVSGPNVPNPGLRPQPQFWKNRGVKIVEVTR
jgi:hypothetical protein